MPEMTPIVVTLLAAMLAMGFILGWILRGGRISREKTAINSGWREQMAAQKTEHDRLAEQNKNLMEQISQFRASKKDADLRAKELSDSLKEAFARRDDLQRQIKETRSNLEVVVAQRDKLKSEIDSVSVRNQASASALKEKDQKIFNMSRELESWKSRLPPLIERFRLRDLEAEELEAELRKARDRVAALEKFGSSDETRIEPVDTNPIADGLDASNDQYDETSEQEVSRLTGQESDEPAADLAEDDERTGIDTYLAEGTVDFDLAGTEPGKSCDADADAAGNGSVAIAADTGARADEDEDECVEASGQARDDDAESTADDDHHDPSAGDGEAHGEASTTATNSSRRTANSRDDLQQIKGVGPAIEKTLNDLGIYRFNQIAEMSEYDIDRVARELRGFRSRIYREDWIGQARILQYEKTSGTA